MHSFEKKRRNRVPKAFSAEIKKQWKENIVNQRESGLSVAVWCRQKNIHSYTFRYWENKLLPKIPWTVLHLQNSLKTKSTVRHLLSRQFKSIFNGFAFAWIQKIKTRNSMNSWISLSVGYINNRRQRTLFHLLSSCQHEKKFWRARCYCGTAISWRNIFRRLFYFP